MSDTDKSRFHDFVERSFIEDFKLGEESKGKIVEVISMSVDDIYHKQGDNPGEYKPISYPEDSRTFFVDDAPDVPIFSLLRQAKKAAEDFVNNCHSYSYKIYVKSTIHYSVIEKEDKTKKTCSYKCLVGYTIPR